MVWSSYGVLGQRLNSGDPKRSTPVKSQMEKECVKIRKGTQNRMTVLWRWGNGPGLVFRSFKFKYQEEQGWGCQAVCIFKQSWSDCDQVDHKHLTVGHVGLIRRKGSRCSLGSDFNSLQDFYRANLLFLESMVTAEERDSHGKTVMPTFILRLVIPRASADAFGRSSI